METKQELTEETERAFLCFLYSLLFWRRGLLKMRHNQDQQDIGGTPSLGSPNSLV
jgi:hypothetical protein